MSQFRIGRNMNLREHRIPLPLLSYAWFEQAWPDGFTPDEIEMAAAIASVTVEPSHESLRQGKTAPVFPLQVNVFGVEVQAKLLGHKRTHFSVLFPQARPQRAVWHAGDPLQVLIDVAHRRLVDAAESDAMLAAGTYRCPARIIDRLLSDDPSFDLEFIAKWVPPLTLINWTQPAPSLGGRWGSMPQIRADGMRRPSTQGLVFVRAQGCDGVALLDALFRPLFQPAKLMVGSGNDRRPLLDARNDEDGREGETGPRKPPPALSRRLFNLIRRGALKEAVELAQSRYLAVQCQTVRLAVRPTVDPCRLAAALLVPMRVGDLQARFNRWVLPTKNISSRRTT